jgi:uncharacterized protein YbjT (DUF2867 family)
MRVVLLGSTGVVGDAILREALADDRITSVFAVARRPLTHTHRKLTVVLHDNFNDFSSLGPALADTAVVLCALGISWYHVKVNERERVNQAGGAATREARYRQITHDYVLACARVAAIANPSIRFCFVSGHGASATSAQPWARVKAETEHDLDAMFGSRLTIFRPGYVYPSDGRATPYWGDALMRPFMPFRSAMSRWITDSREVARAVLHCATGGTVPSPADNRAIIDAGAAYGRGVRGARGAPPSP